MAIAFCATLRATILMPIAQAASNPIKQRARQHSGLTELANAGKAIGKSVSENFNKAVERIFGKAKEEAPPGGKGLPEGKLKHPLI